MSQQGIDVIPLLMDDGQRAISVCKQSDQSREGMSCGLDVGPEVASHEMVEPGKEHEKTTNSNIHDHFGRRDERQRADLYGHRT